MSGSKTTPDCSRFAPIRADNAPDATDNDPDVPDNAPDLPDSAPDSQKSGGIWSKKEFNFFGEVEFFFAPDASRCLQIVPDYPQTVQTSPTNPRLNQTISPIFSKNNCLVVSGALSALLEQAF